MKFIRVIDYNFQNLINNLINYLINIYIMFKM